MARLPHLASRLQGFGTTIFAEVLVTAGATEALAASMLALCEPGDEVHEHLVFDGTHQPLPSFPDVIGVPGEVFYQDREHGRRLVRFCFAKTDTTLDEAGDRMVSAFAPKGTIK